MEGGRDRAFALEDAGVWGGIIDEADWIGRW